MRVAIAGLLVVVAAIGAVAQPQEGDIVFGPRVGPLFYADGELSTSQAWPNGGGSGAMDVKTSGRNDEVVFPHWSGVSKVDAAGVVTSLSTVSVLEAIELTPAGYVGCIGSRLVDAINGTTIASFGNAICIDLCRNVGTGEIAVTGTSGWSGFLAVVDSTGRVTTLTKSIPIAPTGICYIPDLDLYCITTRASPTLLLSSTGAWVASIATNSWRCAYDQRTRRLYLASALGTIFAYSIDGVIVKSLPTSVWAPGVLDVFGDRNVSVRSTSKRGSTVAVDLRFKRAGIGRPYCAALSLGIRPGIATPAGYIHLQPDTLFFASLCGGLPGVTNGFAGTLGAGGAASASFTIPPTTPVGTTIYVQATALDPGRPGGLEIGNTESIRVAP